MVATQSREAFFHAPGVEALLRCGGEGCTLDVSLCGSLIDRQNQQAILEVLLQPLDRRTRLPNGWPISLIKETLELVYLARKDRAVGRSWLADIEPDVAPDCYYRLTPTNARCDEP